MERFFPSFYLTAICKTPKLYAFGIKLVNLAAHKKCLSFICFFYLFYLLDILMTSAMLMCFPRNVWNFWVPIDHNDQKDQFSGCLKIWCSEKFGKLLEKFPSWDQYFVKSQPFSLHVTLLKMNCTPDALPVTF